MKHVALRKAAAVIISFSTAISFCSCSLFGPKPEEIVEAADTFAETLLRMDTERIAKLTTEKKNSKTVSSLDMLFNDPSYSSEQNKFIEAVTDTITYEVDTESVEIAKDSASVDVIFTLTDYEEALSGQEFSDIDEVVSAVGSCDETYDVAVTFEFEKDEDNGWLLSNLKDDGFTDLFSYCTYEFEIKIDLVSIMSYTDIWNDEYVLYGSVIFSESVEDVAGDLSYDVYRDGELLEQDIPGVLITEGCVYCYYSASGNSPLPAGEYEFRLYYLDEEICSMSYTVEAPAPEPVRSDSDLITVGIVNSDPNESGYRSLNDLDMKLMFNVENGYDAAFFYSIQNSDQITGAEEFISEGVDYLLICPTDTAGWDSVLEDAQAAGVRVIFFDRMADVDESLYETYVHPDPEQEGEQAVSWLESQNLLSYDIVHLQGVMGSDAQTGRTYPLDVMVAAYGNWNYVTQQTAEWDSETAYQIVQSVIDSGESFNVIYAENDDMAQGAVQALDEANISHGIGGEVIIVSFDCHTWALEELLAGEWNYDQQCNPFQASYIDSAIRDLEAGIEPPKDIVVDEMGFDAMTITQDDIDTYGTW